MAIRIIFHDSAFALGIAGLAGVLALLGVVAVSAPTQETIRLWIRHRAEHKLAAAERFAIMRRIRAGTGGRRWTKGSAAAIRSSAAAYTSPVASLPEIMRITRQTDTTGASPGRAAPASGGSLPAASGDGIARGKLGIAPSPDPSAEPQ